MKFKIISLIALIFCGLYTVQSSAFFYGAVIMQNPETKKIVVFLSDAHLKWEYDNDKEMQ